MSETQCNAMLQIMVVEVGKEAEEGEGPGVEAATTTVGATMGIRVQVMMAGMEEAESRVAGRGPRMGNIMTSLMVASGAEEEAGAEAAADSHDIITPTKPMNLNAPDGSIFVKAVLVSKVCFECRWLPQFQTQLTKAPDQEVYMMQDSLSIRSRVLNRVLGIFVEFIQDLQQSQQSSEQKHSQFKG